MCEQQFQHDVMDEQRQAVELPKQPSSQELVDFIFESMRLMNESVARQINGGRK